MAVSHLSEDEQALIEAIREIALERVAPRAAEIDHTGEFPWDMKELLAQQDILAMPFPSEYGGIGASELAIVMAIEELSRHCATTGLLLAVQQLGSTPVLLAGNEQHVTAAELSTAGAAEGLVQIVPANDTLFTSGTMGRYSKALNSVLENKRATPEVMAD